MALTEHAGLRTKEKLKGEIVGIIKDGKYQAIEKETEQVEQTESIELGIRQKRKYTKRK